MDAGSIPDDSIYSKRYRVPARGASALAGVNHDVQDTHHREWWWSRGDSVKALLPSGGFGRIGVAFSRVSPWPRAKNEHQEAKIGGVPRPGFEISHADFQHNLASKFPS